MNESPSKQWIVYMLKCKDDSIYTGITNDLENRIKTHNEGKGAKYTRVRLPVNLVYSESCEDRSKASKREFAIKQLKRDQKLRMIKDYKA